MQIDATLHGAKVHGSDSAIQMISLLFVKSVNGMRAVTEVTHGIITTFG